MLESAAAAPEEVQEDIAPVRQRTPELQVLLHDDLQVARRLCAVERSHVAGANEVVLRAANRELVYIEDTENDWRVDQFVVAPREILIRFPARRRIQRRHGLLPQP